MPRVHFNRILFTLESLKARERANEQFVFFPFLFFIQELSAVAFVSAVSEEMAFPLYDVGGNAGLPPVYEICLHQESAESSSID
jgi:hypothetical protein